MDDINFLKQAKWIWNSSQFEEDEYAVFQSNFLSQNKECILLISADTDYMVYVNNKLVAFNQYNSYPDSPVYNKHHIKCKVGVNDLKIVVNYCGGKDFSTYYFDKPGLIFSLVDGEKVLLSSDENIKSGLSLIYESHHKEKITLQLSYRSFLNLTKNDNNIEFSNSVLMDKSYNFSLRENNHLIFKKAIEPKIIKIDDLHYIFDLEKEMTGYLDFDIISSGKQKVYLYWGEHIVDGGVRRFNDRKFYFDITLKKGRNINFQTFRRLGLRYLDLYLEKPIQIKRFTVRPVFYPFKEKKRKFNDPLRQKIYDTAVNTLKCCYHEHFEDCPWREQSFYAMDSRNQILFHTKAFKNKETISSSINLLLNNRRKDGMLSITYPSSLDLVIVSYGLYVFEMVYQYYKFSKDKQFLKKTYPRLLEILIPYRAKKLPNGLIDNFSGENYWNFYEWVDGLDGMPMCSYKEHDAMLSLLYLYALINLEKIEKVSCITTNLKSEIKQIRFSIKKEFYDKNANLLFFANYNKTFYESVNALGILCGVFNKKEQAVVASKIEHNQLIKCSLAFKGFIYDALLNVDKNHYKDFILNDIDTIYKKQLDSGATSFWETELGEKDFDGAGSLCHAWSALPIYYYSVLDKGD